MPGLLWPSWRWMTISATPSRAISTACACRSWCGAKGRRTPAAAAVRRSSARAAAGDQWRPRVPPLMMHSSGLLLRIVRETVFLANGFVGLRWEGAVPASVGRFGWLIGATVLVSCLSAPVAQSSFPGQNGRLAFDFETRCGLKDIAKMRPDGSDLRFLTPNACKRYRTDYDEPERIAPDWSPDGRRLLFLQEADYS